jgi:hypothetical protein
MNGTPYGGTPLPKRRNGIPICESRTALV